MSGDKMREALEAIEHALKMGFSPAEVLDENSPIRDGIREALAQAEQRGEAVGVVDLDWNGDPRVRWLKLPRTVGEKLYTAPVVPDVADGNMLEAGVASLQRGFKCFPDNMAQVVSNIYEDMLAAAPTVAAPVVPEGWREFIAECATFAGKEVNGNRLSDQAAKLLAAAPEVPRG